MLCHTEDGEFYLLVKGYELKTLPNVPIVCPPLLNTSTHKLALETNPVWCLRVRHKGHYRTKTRPKVRVYPEGNGQCPAVSFYLPAQPRFESVDAVFAALAKTEYTLNLHDMQIRPAVHKRDQDLTAMSKKAYESGFQAGKEEGRYLGAYEQTVDTADVFDHLAQWNAKTEAELKARRPKLRLPAPSPTADIIDIQQFLKDRGVEMVTGEVCVSQSGVLRETA